MPPSPNGEFEILKDFFHDWSAMTGLQPYVAIIAAGHHSSPSSPDGVREADHITLTIMTKAAWHTRNPFALVYHVYSRPCPTGRTYDGFAVHSKRAFFTYNSAYLDYNMHMDSLLNFKGRYVEGNLVPCIPWDLDFPPVLWRSPEQWGFSDEASIKMRTIGSMIFTGVIPPVAAKSPHPGKISIHHTDDTDDTDDTAVNPLRSIDVEETPAHRTSARPDKRVHHLITQKPSFARAKITDIQTRTAVPQVTGHDYPSRKAIAVPKAATDDKVIYKPPFAQEKPVSVHDTAVTRPSMYRPSFLQEKSTLATVDQTIYKPSFTQEKPEAAKTHHASFFSLMELAKTTRGNSFVSGPRRRRQVQDHPALTAEAKKKEKSHAKTKASSKEMTTVTGREPMTRSASNKNTLIGHELKTRAPRGTGRTSHVPSTPFLTMETKSATHRTKKQGNIDEIDRAKINVKIKEILSTSGQQNLSTPKEASPPQVDGQKSVVPTERSSPPQLKITRYHSTTPDHLRS